MNNFYNRVAALAARTKARSEDVRDELDAVSAGFDLLPTPDGAGTGFSDPVVVGTPTLDAHATTKVYVDTFISDNATNLAGAQAAQTAAETAQGLAEAARDASQTAQGLSETAQAATEAALDSFTDLYLGAKAVAPTLDNDGDPLQTGALYYDTAILAMRTWTGSAWENTASVINGTSNRQQFTATGGQTNFTFSYDPPYIDVYLNGVKLVNGTDVTVTSGTEIVLAVGAAANDILDVVAYGSFLFTSPDHYTKAESDAKYQTLAQSHAIALSF